MRLRLMLFCALLGISAVAAAQSQFIARNVQPKLLAWGFNAPEVTDKSKIVASRGDIAIETTGGNSTFYGYDGSNWKSFEAANATPAYNYTSQTSAYNASPGDWVLCSGASFTVTLPTAVGSSGQAIIIQHNGTSLTQVYTLNTTLSQTINGPGGTVSSGNYKLVTNGEKVVLFSDGSNWQVIDHQTVTDWVLDTTNTVTAATPPGKGTTSTDAVYWRRVGKEMQVRANLVMTAAGSAGSGIYRWAVPASQTIDNTSITAYTGTSLFAISSGVGGGWAGNSAAAGAVLVNIYDTTHVSLFYSASTPGFVSGTALSFAGAGQSYSFYYTVPISGWQP